MEKIKALYDHLAVKNIEKGKGMQLPPRTFKKRYPEYDRKDGKKHLLYIAPCLNGRGYYRAILPALELNQVASHSAIITEIPKWNFNKRFLDYVSPIDSRLIKWAHYIIFPAIDKDISYLIQGWKNQNKEVQLVMDLEENIHAMPRAHLQYTKISSEDKKQVLSNMAQMDLLTGASKGLLDYYETLIDQYHPSSRVTMGYLPNLVSSFGYEELSPVNNLKKLKMSKSSKIRVGIIASAACSYDVCSILPVLKQINKKYGDQVELVLFGWNGQLPGGKNRLVGVKFSFHKSVRFTDYFETLNQLALDIGLLPMQKIPYNTHGKSFIKYLEFAVLGIPVIAANHSPYKEVIDQVETGFLAATFQEWMTAIDQLIAKEELRNQMGKNALKKAWSTYSYTRENLKRYQVVFR